MKAKWLIRRWMPGVWIAIRADFPPGWGVPFSTQQAALTYACGCIRREAEHR